MTVLRMCWAIRCKINLSSSCICGSVGILVANILHRNGIASDIEIGHCVAVVDGSYCAVR